MLSLSRKPRRTLITLPVCVLARQEPAREPSPEFWIRRALAAVIPANGRPNPVTNVCFFGRAYVSNGVSLQREEEDEMDATVTVVGRELRNKGKLVGQEAPLKVKDIRAIRVRLQLQARTRDLALFELGIV
jgi:hypothetical protein